MWKELRTLLVLFDFERSHRYALVEYMSADAFVSVCMDLICLSADVLATCSVCLLHAAAFERILKRFRAFVYIIGSKCCVMDSKSCCGDILVLQLAHVCLMQSSLLFMLCCSMFEAERFLCPKR